VPRIVFAIVLASLTSAAWAHDFWIEPSSFHPPAGATVAIELRQGQDFVGDSLPYQSGAVDEFFLVEGSTRTRISGTNNLVPAGVARLSAQATAVIAYSSRGSFIKLPADQFEDYLRQYGLDDVVAERRRLGESARPGRERFYRYAKALLSGAASSSTVTKAAGFRYEIVPSEDPTLHAASFSGHALYEGNPLAGATVEALLRSDPSVRLSVRSDDKGGFAFRLPHPGVWLIKSVHMVRAGFFSDADWESAWASLSFELTGPQ
jgi:hypothetical protein